MRTAGNSSQLFYDAPKQTIKNVQADRINGFVRKTLLGLPGFHGCGYGAVDEGQVIIPEVRIRTHIQTEHIYDIYYRLFLIDYLIKPSAAKNIK